MLLKPNVLNIVVPISRFNKGEASKIFDEVNAQGPKLVIKNNKPTCVLIPPKDYEDMLETIENYKLFAEAEKRTSENCHTVSQTEVMKHFGITDDEIDAVEADIE